jgi:hypothetical protein
VRRWLDALRADPRLAGVGVLVRPHPQNAAQWDGVDLSGHGGVAIWPPRGAQPDAGDARADFFDSLAHSTAVIGINTSALVEAAIVGRSVLSPAADEFAGTQEGTLHFRYLLFENGGFLHLGATLEQHFDQLAAVLEHGDEHAARTRRFIGSFVRPLGLDRPAAPILADAFEALGRSAAQPSHRSAGDRALRVLLTPAAAIVSLVGGIAGRVRKAPPAAEIA